jgi:hypothetical protein
MFFAGMSASYGLFVPDPNMLWAFIYIIPLGIGVALIASAEAELDRAAKKQTGASPTTSPAPQRTTPGS